MNFFKILKKNLQHNANIKKFLNETISLAECQQLIKRGIENREDNFLFCIRNLIYNQKRNPYLELLRLSRISYEDVKKMVAQEGIEDTLQLLKEEGIYITFEEFKGKKEVRRKGGVFKFQQKDFSNPSQKSLGEVYSGASRGSGTQISWGLGYLMQKTIHEAIMLNIHGCFNTPIALWYPTFPAQTALYPIRLKKLGILPDIWFSQVEKNVPLSLSEKTIFLLVSLFRNSFSFREIPFQYVSLKDAYIIAEWTAQKIKEFSTCSIHTYVSAALRVCLAAKERGLDIRNTKFIVAGEPLTKIKRREIEELGCEVISTYYFTEAGFIGCSCNNPNHKEDEIHVFRDSFAIIHRPRLIENSEQKVNAFLFTSLYPECPIVMLNMENGDYGNIEEKGCGCQLDRYGFFDHIYNIRSYEKITAEGTTYYISDIIKIIEEVFPSEFGGSSIDYQSVEETDSHGLVSLAIYVNPQIKLLNEEKLKQILFTKLSNNIDRDTRMKMWIQVDTLKIRRELPLVTPRGKTPPFYQKYKE